ncbi:hypothetical protein PABY_21280 [Pyrodictium abyssi]|uniref:Type II secretion system protein GspF domain-containing protein n=1 Tax=Pyrodictium abyssi TaxID=54256 RepID=A0ABM8IYD8_9CREN|nr:hypothetical protein PABY_21280 [Pyrodictium abyssi]
MLGLGIFLFALVVMDLATGLFYRLALYPSRRLVLAAALSMIALGVVSSTLQLERSPLLAAIGAAPIAPGAWLLYRLKKKAEERPEEPRGLLRYVVPAVLGITPLGERITARLGILEAADRAGIRWTRLEAAAITSLVLVAGLASTCIILGVAALTGSRLLLAVSPLPLLVLPLLRLHLDAKAKERARIAEEELPYLSLWAWLLERSGSGGLEDALEEARRSGLLLALGADAGKSLEELARRHPSRRLRRFYAYYLAIRDTGGDVAAFLADILRSEIDELRARVTAYAENGVALGTGLLGMLGTALIFVLFSAFLGAGGAGLAAIAILLAAPMGYLVLSMQQPRLRERYEDAKAAVAAVVAASAAALLGSLLMLPAIMAVGLAATAGLSVYGVAFRAQKRIVNKEEQELLPLLRMVIEYTRSMSDKPISQLLGQAAGSVEEPLAGVARAAAKTGNVAARSWLARYTLYTVVKLVGGQGASDPLALERLYDLVYAHVNTYKAASMRLRMLGALAVGFPPVVVAAASGLQKIVGGTVAPMLQALPVSFTGGIAEVIAWLALLGAGVMGFLAAKAVSLTVRDTLWPLAAVLATLLSILAFGAF